MSEVDPEVVGRLFEEHASVLELYARQWSLSAQDIVQEAFLKLFRQAVIPVNVVPWLFRVVRNEAITASRNMLRRERYERSRLLPMAAFQPCDDRALDSAEVTRQLASLPLEQREVIVAHIWGKLSFEQIAELSETSSSTAHRLYQAGLTALRERLEFKCPTESATHPEA